jgi:hypothetical protein
MPAENQTHSENFKQTFNHVYYQKEIVKHAHPFWLNIV